MNSYEGIPTFELFFELLNRMQMEHEKHTQDLMRHALDNEMYKMRQKHDILDISKLEYIEPRLSVDDIIFLNELETLND